MESIKSVKKLVELKQGDKSAYILSVNDATCGCPHKQPIPKQNPMTNQMQVDAQPCMSNCPLFDISTDADTGLVLASIYCGGQIIDNKIDEVIYAEKLQSKTLIV